MSAEKALSALPTPDMASATLRCAEAAFGFVTSIVTEVAKRRGAKDTLPLVIAAWSLAHGAATLLLEGKLDRHYGTTDKKRMAGAKAAIEAFGNLLGGD